jgi:hypothetical protein
MAQILLCIDDQPERFFSLRERISKIDSNIVVVITCRIDDFFWYLNGPDKIIGVCLDHDMPYRDGTFFAEQLGEYSYPVAIVSQNPSGTFMIQSILNEWSVSNRVTTCSWKDWEDLALEHFGFVIKNKKDN